MGSTQHPVRDGRLKCTLYFETVRLRPDRAMIRLGVDPAGHRAAGEGGDSSGRSHSSLGSHQRDGRSISPRRVAARRRDGTQCVLRPFVHAVKIKYFQDTDTLYIEFRVGEIAVTKDLDENTQLDLDRGGNICAITMEHARERADLPQFSFEQVGT